jgi:asparagine N-glycosylation enzyme membrane subunit Stt3
MSADTRRLIVSAVAGLLGFLAALAWRGYRIELSVVTGIAVALLAFAALRTVERMRHTLRR